MRNSKEGTQSHLLEMGGRIFLRSVYGTQTSALLVMYEVASYSRVSSCTLIFGDISNIFSCSRYFVADFDGRRCCISDIISTDG